MNSGTTCAIVPVKVLAHAKRRLSSVLPDAARQRLVLTMLEDVLAALVGARSVDWMAVVTADQRVAALAQRHGASVLPEPGPDFGSGLEPAVGGGLGHEPRSDLGPQLGRQAGPELPPEISLQARPEWLPESLPESVPESLSESLAEPLAEPLAQSRQQLGSAALNGAIASGLAYACSRGARRVLVLPADVPLTTSSELQTLVLSRGEQAGVTLAPSHDNNGTNGLLLAPPLAIAPCYGPGSYLQHVSRAMARRVDVNVVHLEGLARDIDEPDDLVRLLGDAGARKRYGFIAPYLIASKLQPTPQGNGQ
jgi:2-phospho-L-lactate guanylyltransferase